MRYLIIGNGAAGCSAASTIRKNDPRGQVMILSGESQPAYYRPLIPGLITGSADQEALLGSRRLTPEGVEVRLGAWVEAINTQQKTVKLGEKIPPAFGTSSKELSYERLLLATGSSAIRPQIPGLDGPQVHTLRTLADAVALYSAVYSGGRAVIIGGGRVGMKAAVSLAQREMSVAVVERLDWIVPLQFDRLAGEMLGRAVEALGIELYLGQSVKKVVREGNRIVGVVLGKSTDASEDQYADSIEVLKTDLVLCAVGVEPNVGLAKEAGLAVDRGVVVNDLLQTSDPNIFAAGDVVQAADVVTGEPIVSGLWTNAVEMGRVAGNNMSGSADRYPGAYNVLNAFELAGIPSISIGIVDPPSNAQYRVKTIEQKEIYHKLVFKDSVLVGALLVGNIKGAGVYTGLIRRRAQIERLGDRLFNPRAVGAWWLG